MSKLSIFIGISILLLGCAKDKIKNFAVLSGKVNEVNIDTLILKGEKSNILIPISENGSFSDTILLDSLYYFNFSLNKKDVDLYLKPGSDVQMSIDLQGGIPVINYTGIGSEENNYLFSRSKIIKKLNDSLKFFRYYSKPDSVKEKSIVLKEIIDKNIDTITTFDYSFKKQQLKHNDYYYLTNIHKYVDYVQSDSLPKNYFNGLEQIDLSDKKLYNAIPDYRKLVQRYYTRKNAQEDMKLMIENDENYPSQLNAFLETVKDIPKGAMKDDFMKSNNALILYPTQNEEDIERVYTTLMTSTNEKDRIEYEEKYQRLKKLRKGNPSPGFILENFKGGTTSLEDFKGKYVFIDIWATWCAPCIEQFPYIEDLKKKYKNNNIEFVGISIDKAKDKEKWKNLVKKKELQNSIQLFAGSIRKSEFMKEYFLVDENSYMISIPRFILIDPYGNIFDRSAPFPTQTEKIDELFSKLNI